MSQKYRSIPAISPGGSLVFRYTIAPGLLDVPDMTFTVHVGAVFPTPTHSGVAEVWTPAKYQGDASWYDRALVTFGSPTAPEPNGLVAALLWCGGLVALGKRVRPRGNFSH